MTVENRRPLAGAAVLRGEITTAIRRAVLEELAAVGYGRLSIEAIARRAGVGKTAIYRRWSSKLEIVLEVVASVAGQSLPLPDTGSLRGDLDLVLRIVAHALQHPLASQIVPDLLAEAARTPEIAQTLQDALRDRQREVGTLLTDRAVARGELAAGADPELAVDLVIGPLYWRLAVARTDLEPSYLGDLAVAAATALIAAHPPARPPAADLPADAPTAGTPAAGTPAAGNPTDHPPAHHPPAALATAR